MSNKRVRYSYSLFSFRPLNFPSRQSHLFSNFSRISPSRMFPNVSNGDNGTNGRCLVNESRERIRRGCRKSTRKHGTSKGTRGETMRRLIRRGMTRRWGTPRQTRTPHATTNRCLESAKPRFAPENVLAFQRRGARFISWECRGTKRARWPRNRPFSDRKIRQLDDKVSMTRVLVVLGSTRLDCF